MTPSDTTEDYGVCPDERAVEALDLNDPEVQAEILIVLSAMARLLARFRQKERSSRSKAVGKSVFQRKIAPSDRNGGPRRRR